MADKKTAAAKKRPNVNKSQISGANKAPSGPTSQALMQGAQQLNMPALPLAQRQQQARQLGSVLGNQGLINAMATAPKIQRDGELTGTGPIETDEQETVNEILNPNQTDTGETEPFIPEDFDTDMVDLLDDFVTTNAESAREQLDPSSPKLDLNHIQQNIAAEAQTVVRDRYSGYAGAASMSASNRRHQNRYQLGQNVRSYASQRINTAALRDLTEYLMTVSYVGGPAMTDHHVDRDRGPDRRAFRRIRDAYIRDHRDDLTVIQRAWPGEMDPSTLRVFIQTNLAPDDNLDADAVTRRGYWGTFQTLIHEYIHVLEHPLLYDMADQQSSTGYQILVEGMCDHFALQVWKAVEPTLSGDPARRERIEGQALPYEADAIPDWHSYPEIVQADEIVQEVGEENARAAYFMGHTELLGGGDFSAQDADRDGTYTVPRRGKSVADVATITNIPAAELATLNSVAEDATFPADEVVDAPGTRYHVVIRHDVGLRIADQYGIAFDLLRRANPGITWRSIRPGQRLLIPRP